MAELHQAEQDGDTARIREMLRDQPDWVVEDAATALGEMRCYDAIPDLARVLGRKGASPQTRAAVARALASMATPDSVEVLAAALKRAGNPEERYWLVVDLGRTCAEGALEVVQELQFDSDVLVARAAKKAMKDCWEE